MTTIMHTPSGHVSLCSKVLALILISAGAAFAQQILPLGDSITDGFQVAGGYRTELYLKLTNAGSTFTFLGSQTGNASGTLTSGGQIHHEGHSGYRTDQIYNNLLGNDGSGGNNGGHWLDGGNGTGRLPISPDIVLLHIGTNDRTQGENVQSMTNKLAILLNMLRTNQPNAKVFVASLVPRTDNASFEADQQAYNALIPGMVASMGTNFHFVDMHSIVKPGQLADGVHPTQAGYDAMGDAWFEAIQAQQGVVGEIHASNIGNNTIGDPLNSTFYFTSGQTTSPNGALVPSLITGSVAVGNTPDVGSLAGLNDLAACGQGSGVLGNMTYYGNSLFGSSLAGGATVTNTIALGGSSPAVGGYTLNQILVFSGWTDHASFCDQHYTLSVSRDGTNYIALRSVNYMPFATADDLNDAGQQDSSTLVTLTNLNANGLATGIKFIRLVYSAGLDANNQEQQGQLIQEIEVFGATTFPVPSKVVPGKISEYDYSAIGDNSGGTNNSQFYFTSGRSANTSAALQNNLLTGSTITSSTGGADVGNTAAANNVQAAAGTGAIAYYGNTLFGNSLSTGNVTTQGKVVLTVPLGGNSPSPTGYSLTSLSSFCGWGDHASFSDQNYDLSVSRDGTNYLHLYTVNYMPFAVASDLGSGQSSSSLVVLSNLNASGLATGIKYVRFTFTAGKDANNQSQQGLAIQELEVFGTPTPAESVVVNAQSNSGNNNLGDPANSQFYFTSGQTVTTGAALTPNLLTGSAVTSSTGGADVGSPAMVNDVNAVSGTGAIAYYGNTLFGSSLSPNNSLTRGVVTLTIPLGGAAPAPGGYDLSSIKVFEGWLDHASFNNQHYTVSTSTDGTNFTYLRAVDYMPFAAADDLGNDQFASTLVTLTGLNVSGVKAIRFTFSAGTDINGALQQGQLLQEIEVFGSPTGGPTVIPGQINATLQSSIGDNSGGTNNSQFYFTSGRSANLSGALQANLATGSTVETSTGWADVGDPAAVNNLTAESGVNGVAYFGNTLFGSSLDPNNGLSGKVSITIPLGGASPSATGYTLSSLSTFCGWEDHASFSDQHYDVYVSRDGLDFQYLHSVHYAPFLVADDLDASQRSSSLVTLTNLNAAGLATGIKSVRFTFSAGRDENDQLQQGLAIQEIEIFGTPSPAGTVVQLNETNIGNNSNGDAANSQFYFTSGQTTTLGAALTPNLLTGSTVTSSTGGADVGGTGTINDGNATTGVGGIAYYGNTLFGTSLNPGTALTHGSVTLTIPLGGVSPSSGGYNLTSIKVFEGWLDHASFVDQHYVVTTSTDGTNYTFLHAVDYMPYAAWEDLGADQSASTLVTLTNLNATGVKYIRFTLSAGTDVNVALQQGQLIQEIEVFGSSVETSSPPVITTVTASGNNVIISGTNGWANATYYVLTSTNLATWTYESTNQFGANGSFNVTNAISSGIPKKFYRLLVP